MKIILFIVFIFVVIGILESENIYSFNEAYDDMRLITNRINEWFSST